MANVEHQFEQEVPVGTVPVRIDRWVTESCSSFPRSAASDGNTRFFIDGQQVKKGKKVQSGERVRVEWTEHSFDHLEGEAIPLNVLYEDAHVLVLDKQQDLVVHPGAGNPDGTLVNALVHRYGKQFFSSGETDDAQDDTEDSTVLRPGIVHRLDKDTSGVMVVALDRESHASLAFQFKHRSVEKYYIAIVCNRMPRRRGRVETTIVRDRADRKRFTVGSEGEGKVAVTEYLVLHQFATHALVRLRLLTGRTHQIRVHMRSLGCPILGDPIYGSSDKLFPSVPLMLHAFSLEFDHPVDRRRMRVRAPMPQRLKTVLRTLIK